MAKKLLSVIIAGMMVLSMTAFTANAEEEAVETEVAVEETAAEETPVEEEAPAEKEAHVEEEAPAEEEALAEEEAPAEEDSPTVATIGEATYTSLDDAFASAVSVPWVFCTARGRASFAFFQGSF